MESGRVKDTIVKPKLFEPPRSLKLSVFRIHGLQCEDIKALGREAVRGHSKATKLYGWAELRESVVEANNLRLDDDNDPPRHADIVDWPVEVEDRKQLAQVLASNSTPIVLTAVEQVK